MTPIRIAFVLTYALCAAVALLDLLVWRPY